MEIKIITKPIARKEALGIVEKFYKDMIKCVVDIDKEIIALGGEYHIDANMFLIEQGSLQPALWGFNLYPGREGENWIEYTSLINIRPNAKNRTMTVEDKIIRGKMKEIIESLIK